MYSLMMSYKAKLDLYNTKIPVSKDSQIISPKKLYSINSDVNNTATNRSTLNEFLDKK